jgi:uncharacterized membrane protein
MRIGWWKVVMYLTLVLVTSTGGRYIELQYEEE